MKKQILAVIALILVFGGVVAMNFFMSVPAASNIFPCSDTITAPDPNWPTPEEMARSQEILQQLLDK